MRAFVAFIFMAKNSTRLAVAKLHVSATSTKTRMQQRRKKVQPKQKADARVAENGTATTLW